MNFKDKMTLLVAVSVGSWVYGWSETDKIWTGAAIVFGFIMLMAVIEGAIYLQRR